VGSWDRKVSVDELIKFCKNGKTRSEIAEEFGLTKSESWSATKYLEYFKDEIEVKKRKGLTRKAYIFVAICSK
jgi:uncharacterized protein (DUF433 family)